MDTGRARRTRWSHHRGGDRGHVLKSKRIIAGVAGVLFALSACSSSEGATDAGDSATANPKPGDSGGDRVLIRRMDLQITYRLEGQSQNSSSVGLMSNPQLAFVPRRSTTGEVEAGVVVGRTVVDGAVRAALEAGSATSSLDKAQLAQLQALQGPIKAPVAGVLRLNRDAPTVQAPGVDVAVPLTPIQYLRYQSLRFSGRATIETVIGERQVACDAVWIVQTSGSGGASELHCRLPRYVETGAGLRAQLVLESERYRNVVVVPNIFVGYDKATDGYFIDVVDHGRKEKLPIEVGVTDGVVRVVTSEVPVGAALTLPNDG